MESAIVGAIVLGVVGAAVVRLAAAAVRVWALGRRGAVCSACGSARTQWLLDASGRERELVCHRGHQVTMVPISNHSRRL